MTYPLKFRQQVLLIKEEESLTYAQTSQRFRVGVTTLLRWEKKLEPEVSRNKPPTKIDMNALQKDVEQYPDAYQRERAVRLGVSAAGIQHALHRLQVSRKKGPTSPARRCPSPSRFCGKSKQLEEGTVGCDVPMVM